MRGKEVSWRKIDKRRSSTACSSSLITILSSKKQVSDAVQKFQLIRIKADNEWPPGVCSVPALVMGPFMAHSRFAALQKFVAIGGVADIEPAAPRKLDL